MVAVRTLTRAAAVAALIAAASTIWSACADLGSEPTAAPSVPRIDQHPTPDLRLAIAAQQRHTDRFLKISGVVGTAVTVLPDGRAGVQVLLERAGVAGLPSDVDGIPVTTRVTGLLVAFSDPTKRQRPAPLGFSVGHPAITAGTIGARVRDATGRVYILSNNHVLANSNASTIGDPSYQPGPFDGGTAADQIATLADFQPITFSSAATNTIDAAVALTTTSVLDNATPTDDAYGVPSSRMYGDLNGDGQFDDRNALLGLHVQKYGRTTRLTHGTITGVNATVLICYEVVGVSCTKFARFVDQLIISPGGFSNGGDSGSLIVTDDADRSPVALLFAGSATETIGNRIDHVLNRFGVTIDGLDPPPPGPFTDVGVTGLNAPPAVVIDVTTSVTVTVRNLGNQDVPSSFDVTLRDTTEGVTVGTQTVAGLGVGGLATLTFGWTPHAQGSHDLIASHTLSDERASNNQAFASFTVNPPITDIAVTAVTAPPAVSVGKTISVSVTVGNLGNQDVVSSFDVTLEDVTAGAPIGTQAVAGLAPGASTTLTFSWNTTDATLGTHGLRASQRFADDNPLNDQRSIGVTVNPKLIDIAMTSITGPAAVTQGDTAHIGVTLQNVGEVDVADTFAVVLTDATFGHVTLATRTVPGLAIGAVTTLDIPWNTADAVVSGHTLIAEIALATDGKATNNSRALGITVKAPVSLVTDVAVTALNASGVTQGATAAIGVTVQNVGQQVVSTSFNVVLTDSTTGLTIGTQTVTGMAVGAIATLTFTWNTTGVALGNHTLVATHTLTDGNAANNRRSGVIAVNPQVSDLALSNLTGPARVNQGETAHIIATVQNVGQQHVTANFDVVLRDASFGVTIGTQTVSGLALGATTTVDFPWNTTGVDVTGHTLIATQLVADGNASNNARAIGIIVQPPITPVTDAAVTAMTAPASVNQGQSVTIAVTVGNVGNQVVPSFVVTLRDTTAGVTIATQTVNGLAVGASSPLTFTWNTTGAAAGSHTLVASHNLADGNAANNQRSAAVTVNATVMDVAVTSVGAPAAVPQGNSAAIAVTVQNVGQQVAGDFTVTLTDQTAGVTIGSQAVTGLALSASATLSFTWNTAGSAVGSHTLVASHNLSDANAANNQRSAAVTVNPKVVDVALANLVAPVAVTQGDTAHILATVQNVGGQDVTVSFDVVLTEGGVTIGTQTLPGLPAGATVTIDFPWNTAGVATAGHTLIARHTVTDNNASNNSRAVALTVNAPSVHVGNLTGSALSNGTTWTASVEVAVHDSRHAVVSGVVVRGSWGATTGECVTTEAGTCTMAVTLPNTTALVSFAVSGLTCTGYVYKPASNHDPDGSSNGTTIFVRRP